MSEVRLEIAGGVATLTLDNEAKLNALTLQMMAELEAHLVALAHDDGVRCLVLTGTGPKAFCCGADIAAWGRLTAGEFARHWVRDGHRLFDRLARIGKPTIAAMNGHAFGGGLELATACDIRLMTPKARLALPEARVGIVPGWSGTQRVARLLPEPVVKEMALFGRQIGAERAVGFGFVAEVVEDVRLRAAEIAGGLSELSSRATEIAKAMIHVGVGEDPAASIEALGSAAMGATADRDEGVAAFLEKRPAKFIGK
ncbi:MAG: enoyl-CoA hydratase/isomerase family protein [Pseudomonadota bacterium]